MKTYLIAQGIAAAVQCLLVWLVVVPRLRMYGGGDIDTAALTSHRSSKGVVGLILQRVANEWRHTSFRDGEEEPFCEAHPDAPGGSWWISVDSRKATAADIGTSVTGFELLGGGGRGRWGDPRSDHLGQPLDSRLF
jgi:hypothetical protein